MLVGVVVAVVRPVPATLDAQPATTVVSSVLGAPPSSSLGHAGASITPATTNAAPPTTPELLAWMPRPVPPDAVDRLRSLPTMTHLTAVRRGEVGLVQVADDTGTHLGVPPGFEVPADVLAFDVSTYIDFVPAAVVADVKAVRPGEALLGRSAAQVRGVGVGATLTFRGGTTVTVAGIVDDEVVGAAEIAVDLATGARLGVADIRYLLVSYAGTRAQAEAAVAGVVPGPVRFRAPGETPFLRNADAVLPLVKVKLQFGEFSYRSTPAGLEQLPAWTNTYIADDDLPVIGHVRCHLGVLDALRGAMAQLQDEQLGYLVDPAVSEVCWRLGRIHDEPRLTRQAWGIGLQLNNATNPTGSGSVQDRRLIEIMQRWGFAWGGSWLIAEPSYFEYIGPPRPAFSNL